MIILKENIGKELLKHEGVNFVYLLHSNESIIYIGCSFNIYKRLKEHKYQKAFDYVVLIQCDTFMIARELERDLIYKYKPKYNVFGVKKPVPLYDIHPKKKKETTTYKPYTIKELITIHSNILNR